MNARQPQQHKTAGIGAAYRAHFHTAAEMFAKVFQHFLIQACFRRHRHQCALGAVVFRHAVFLEFIS